MKKRTLILMDMPRRGDATTPLAAATAPVHTSALQRHDQLHLFKESIIHPTRIDLGEHLGRPARVNRTARDAEVSGRWVGPARAAGAGSS
jgi:hypothetical protein